MKKYLLTLSVLFGFALASSAQDEVIREKLTISSVHYKEEIVNNQSSFSLFESQIARDSSIYKQEVFPLKKVSGIRYDVVVVTKLSTKDKIASIRLTSSEPMSYHAPISYAFYGYIDPDEISRVIDVLLQYKELFATKHFTETRYDFVTRGKVLFRLHTTSKEYGSSREKDYLMNCYLRTNYFDATTGNNFTRKEIDKIVEVLKDGKKIIEDKLN